jgi:hypothetical protein
MSRFINVGRCLRPAKALNEARWTTVSRVFAKSPFWKMFGVPLVFFQNDSLRKLIVTISYNLTQLVRRLHILLPGNLSGLSSGTVIL